VRVGTERELIERALAPVVENAVRHAAHHVEIVVRGEDGQLVFEIRDDGPGVAPGDRARIFEPGVSLTNRSGTGLGLSLARRLARAAGGEVDCADGLAGGGAFRVRFPLS
jgi:signal transduction histidine kinase